MRKLYNILYAALVALVLASCQSNDESLNAINQRGAIEFTLGFNATRSHFGDKSGSAYPSFWDGNEKLRLAIESSDYPTYRPSGSYAMEKVDAEGKSATFTATIDQYFSNGTVYAFVPATAWRYNPLGNGDFAGFDYTIPTTQTPTAKSVDPAAHILMVQHPFSAGLQSAVSLNFDHIVAYGKLSIPALEDKAVTSVQIDISSASGKEYSYTLNVSGLEEPLYWFACEPCSVSAISIVATTADKQFAYTREFDAEAAVAFNTGRVRPLTIAGELIEPTYPNREIHYTATAKVEAHSNHPWTYDTFGANVVSHEWSSETCEGIITFDGNVTTIGDWAFYFCSSLTSVTIPDSVTTIGDSAFAYCTNLTSVTIPDSVTTIGERAFYECSSLTIITIPDNVTTIGEYAFAYCDSLTEFNGKFASEDGRCLIVDGTLNSFAIGCGATEYTIPDSVTMIGEIAFYNCDSLTSVTIPDSVTTIGDSAFAYCTNLTSVTIPDSVTTIGHSVFFDCNSLTSVTIGDGVTTIGDNAFYNCSSLTSVYCAATTPPSLGGDSVFDDNASDRKIYVPAQSVEAYKSAEYWTEYADVIIAYDFDSGEEVRPSEIPNNQIWYTNGSTTIPTEPYDPSAFGANIVSNSYDSSLKCWVITFNANVSTIGDKAFYCCDSLTSITIPDGVTTIGKWAFYSCDSLTSVTIPDSVMMIGDLAFHRCSGLSSVTIPDSVTTIGNEAFYCCDSLTSITIPDSVTTIGDYAFLNCSSLTSVDIPDSVTTIGSWAFNDCDSLISVYCTATTPPVLGNDSVFDGNGSGRKIYVPTQSVESYKSAEYWTEYADAIVDYDFASGEVVTLANREIRYTATAKVEAYIASPWTYDTFGANVVSNEWNSETGEGVITFDAGVTTIGSNAFEYCESLTSATIPDSVTMIGDLAFYNCTSLISITIPDSVTTIGYGAFSVCDSLTSVTIPDSVTSIGNGAFFYCSSITGVTIPDSVTAIEKDAFRKCSNLISVTIPNSVTTIGDLAFSDCDSLTSVTIPDSVTTIGLGAFDECDKLESVYCQATIPPLGGNNMLGINASDRKIYVPAESVDAYKSAEYWSKYADAIIAYDFENGVVVEPEVSVNREIRYTATAKVEAHSDHPWTYDTFGANVVSNEWNSETGEGVISFDAEVMTIGDYAFLGCSSLTSVTIPDSVTTIGDAAFYECSSLTSITIPDGVTTIGKWAFYSCDSLTSITIPDSVTTIRDYAFRECSSLTSVTIGNSVTTIGECAFYYCESLTSVTIGNSVTTIGDYAFYECSSLTSITIPDSVTTIGDDAFGVCTSLTNVTIGDSVTTIGDSAFYYCESLTSVTIGNSVTTIGKKAFYACSSLTSVTIGDSVTTIGERAFTRCGSLTSVTIGDSVTTIGEWAFGYCTSLTSVTIPDSVTTIGGYAFKECSSLTSVYCKVITPPSLGSEVFYSNGSGRKIYVPAQSVEAYKSAEYWSNYADAIVGYDFK